MFIAFSVSSKLRPTGSCVLKLASKSSQQSGFGTCPSNMCCPLSDCPYHTPVLLEGMLPWKGRRANPEKPAGRRGKLSSSPKEVGQDGAFLVSLWPLRTNCPTSGAAQQQQQNTHCLPRLQKYIESHNQNWVCFSNAALPGGVLFSLQQEPAVRLPAALRASPQLARKHSPFFLKADSHCAGKLGHPAMLLFAVLPHERSDCCSIHAVLSTKCLLATCVHIFKTLTLKNTHQHPNIWIYA